MSKEFHLLVLYPLTIEARDMEAAIKLVSGMKLQVDAFALTDKPELNFSIINTSFPKMAMAAELWPELLKLVQQIPGLKKIEK